MVEAFVAKLTAWSLFAFDLIYTIKVRITFFSRECGCSNTSGNFLILTLWIVLMALPRLLLSSAHICNRFGWMTGTALALLVLLYKFIKLLTCDPFIRQLLYHIESKLSTTYLNENFVKFLMLFVLFKLQLFLLFCLSNCILAEADPVKPSAGCHVFFVNQESSRKKVASHVGSCLVFPIFRWYPVP